MDPLANMTAIVRLVRPPSSLHSTVRNSGSKACCKTRVKVIAVRGLFQFLAGHRDQFLASAQPSQRDKINLIIFNR
jgi:hypothetical protein